MLPTDYVYDELKSNIKDYFCESLANHACNIILAESDDCIVATGIIFYFRSVPSSSNIKGNNAYITSMFVDSQYRRLGIGRSILSRLIDTARNKGYEVVMLNASEMGKKLYTQFGFKEINDGMIYRI